LAALSPEFEIGGGVMSDFPRTEVGGLSLSRIVIGCNWLLGYSHTTPAQDRLIVDQVRNRKAIADILEVFFRAGIDTFMATLTESPVVEAIKDAEDRTGVRCISISTPTVPFTKETAAKGFDLAEVERLVAKHAQLGARLFFPHQCTTDVMVDRCSREIRQMAPVCRLIREHGMLPGLSTHMPETIVYADETGLDVDTYIAIYNSMGFLMQIEVDWVASIIRNAKKPVTTIKPMAAGQLRPFQALNFVWNTIRPIDMVTVGCMTPDEARELIDLSLQILEARNEGVPLQATRSKASVTPRDPAAGYRPAERAQ
jgi:hypothetical protein